MFYISTIELFGYIWTILIKPFWWFWILLFLFTLLPSLIGSYIEKFFTKRWLNKHKRLVEWKKMKPRDFEIMVAVVFENLGYKTKVVGGPGDRGIDVVAHKDGKKFFIQCKRKDQVRPTEIRDFAGAIQKLNPETEKGFFVATGDFSEEGKLFAKNNPIEIYLINGTELEKIVLNNKEAIQKL
jgi:restriction system protein